jgi:hypothetical protein
VKDLSRFRDPETIGRTFFDSAAKIPLANETSLFGSPYGDGEASGEASSVVDEI